ncbi:hypothetical protein SAMN05421847_1544 [Halpernia humi]|uniref:DUF5689 domain-containing protein n=1 Tax=Halpernia humi TaxID=493375 RepID=A0A1H5XT06_9FLAO|nr:DUF5689 domain-containing protein [Halpernia humi]SEG14929.1 hypothetical protein SAMN05421847_1544 [Halpernia humi]
MNIKKYLKPVLSLVITTITITSCVRSNDWETPPITCNNRFDASTTTMADFVAMAPSSGTIKIPEDGAPVIFDAYVISSDENGNFYKTISFQDAPQNPTVGLQMEVDRSSNYADFPVGSHVRIKANGLVFGTDAGVKKLGSVDPTYAVGRIPNSLFSRYIAGVCNGGSMDIVPIIPTELPSLAAAQNEMYINTLVTIKNVQFASSDLGKTYLDYDPGTGLGIDTNRNIEDNTGSKSIIRNSGFFSGGKTLLPKGNGSLTFVVSRYNSTWQNLIRSLADVSIPDTGSRYDASPPVGGTAISYSGSFTENFESYSPTNLEVFPKYINDSFIGNRYWQLKSFGGNQYIQLSANAGSGSYTTYFIVPVDFSAANSMKFDVNVGYYKGNALKVYTTTNYTPLGDMSAATLTDITSNFTIPTTPTTGYGVFTPAGTYNFPTSLTGNGFVVFEYSGANPGVTTTIQLDNIQVQ